MTRVVVVGNGMVGSRFVDDLLDRDTEERFTVTVLGAEEYEPYNRVMLSEVVAGRADLGSLTLPRRVDPRVRIHLGEEAVALDRQRRHVITADGAAHPYDLVVLATGSTARIPSIGGLNPDLPAGVHALRTVDDAREISAAVANARRVTVVGGGVLGVEAACGLAGRGLQVTLLHGSTHPMDRQLGDEAAGLLLERLAGLRMDVRAQATTEHVLLAGGRVHAVRVAGDPDPIPTDLVVLA